MISACKARHLEAKNLMTDPNKPANDETAPEAHAVDTGPSVFADAAPQSPAGEPDPFTVLENLQMENTALKDKSLRTLAEMENLRRRTEREMADAKVYGITRFAQDMLTFADNLRRAVESVPAEAREAADPAVKAFIEGIEVTERDFLSRLARHGVRKMEPQGQKFDPNMHEALFEIPDESVPTGTVAQVVEDGYAIGERCLRPAKVGVSRGGPKVVAG